MDQTMKQQVGTDDTVAEEVELPAGLRLELWVKDQEVIAELCKRNGQDREDFAIAALRLGVLALRQASGMIDSTAIRAEGERMVRSLEGVMSNHFTRNFATISETLKRYFDPASGDLPQRLERLLRKDGELESLLARHLGDDNSTVARTLAKHIGTQSPIFKLLSPQQNDGILAAMTTVIKDALDAQRVQITKQFSMDQEDSALRRLVGEITGANGKLKEEFAKDLAKISREFSLDNEDGALCRLVSRIENAQKTITSEFSLDNESSALSRMSRLLASTNEVITGSLTLDDEKSPLYRLRRELLDVLETLSKSNKEFQLDVRESLAALSARKKEADRSTRHGGEFEEAVGEVLQLEAQRLGDIFQATGNTTGAIPYCKKGDHVLTLGCESAAPDARIVVEAKERASCNLKDALEELAEARKNREAQVGIFVFSSKTVPSGMEPFARHGNDLVVIWDREDPSTDIYLKGAVSIARALAVRERIATEESAADFSSIERSLDRIVKDAALLDEVAKHATTVRSCGEKIFDKASQVRKDLEQQVESLREHIDRLRPARMTSAA